MFVWLDWGQNGSHAYFTRCRPATVAQGVVLQNVKLKLTENHLRVRTWVRCGSEVVSSLREPSETLWLWDPVTDGSASAEASERVFVHHSVSTETL